MAFSAEEFFEDTPIPQKPKCILQINTPPFLKNRSNISSSVSRIRTSDQEFKKKRCFSEQKARFARVAQELSGESPSPTSKQSKINSFFTSKTVATKSSSPKLETILNGSAGNKKCSSEDAENVPPSPVRPFLKLHKTASPSTNSHNLECIEPPGRLTIVTDATVDEDETLLLDYQPLSSPKAEIPGLKNVGNTCYMNASLHALFVYQNVWTELWEKHPQLVEPDKPEPNKHLEVVASLHKLHHDYQANCCEMEASLSDFKKHFGKVHSEFNSSTPQDAPEFITCLIDSISCAVDAIVVPQAPTNLFKKFFFSEITFSRTCTSCSNQVESIDYSSSVVSLAFPETSDPLAKPNISETFQQHFTQQSCEECGKCKQSAESCFILTELSNALIIHINRHSGEAKISKPMVASESLTICLDADKIIRKDDDDRVCERLTYHLKAIVCHRGKLFSNGHYVSYVHHRNSQWYLCNDEYVSPVDYLKVTRDCLHSSYIFFYSLDSL